MVGFELFVPVEEGLMGRSIMSCLALGVGRHADGRGEEVPRERDVWEGSEERRQRSYDKFWHCCDSRDQGREYEASGGYVSELVLMP